MLHYLMDEGLGSCDVDDYSQLNERLQLVKDRAMSKI